MGTYVSPFGNNTAPSGGTKKSTNYISPFQGSQYTEDYWKKKQQDDQVEQADTQKKQQIKDNLAKSEAETKKAKDEIWKPANIVGDIFKAAGNATAAVNEKVLGGATKAVINAANTVGAGFNQKEADKRTADFLKSSGQLNSKGEAPLASGKGINRDSKSFAGAEAVGNMVKGFTVDPLDSGVKSAANLVQQAQIGSEKSSSALDQASADKLKKFVDQDQKAGKLTKAQADEQRNKLQTRVEKTNADIKRGEAKTGVKYDQSSGVVSLLETAANLSGLEGVAKSVYKKTAEAASARLGRSLTEDEAKNLAEQTKKVIPSKPTDAPTSLIDKIAGTKPAEYFFGDKQRVIDARAAKASKDSLEVKPTAELPVVKPTVETPKPAANVALENTLLTAAKTQAETRLGRELNPQELDNLTQQAQKLVAEKMPTAPVETPLAPNAVPESTPLSSGVDQTLPNPELKPLETPKVEGDTVSGNAARIEQRSLEKKLTEKMGDLPQYKSINMKEQAKEAVDLISVDKQKAIDIIEGKVNAPGNLKAQSVHQALEDLAVREGDGELLTKLAKSHVNTELSESAQNLRIAAERDPHSAVEQIRQVRDARLKRAEQRARTSMAKEKQAIKAKVNASTPTVKKETWASFIKDLEC